jgi:hypothetical protein
MGGGGFTAVHRRVHFPLLSSRWPQPSAMFTSDYPNSTPEACPMHKLNNQSYESGLGKTL